MGSGTGALAIFLKKEFNLDITTSDYNDQEIEDNIVHNCIANKIIPSLPHIKREFPYYSQMASYEFDCFCFSYILLSIMTDTWGDEFPISEPDWDLIIASDILLCKYPFPIRFIGKLYIYIFTFGFSQMWNSTQTWLSLWLFFSKNTNQPMSLVQQKVS